jgi:hypothetical protein
VTSLYRAGRPAASGPIQHLLFAVVLPNGEVVQGKVSERLSEDV